ncbi:MAG: hypothetical protein WC307_03175 [Candidatus Nanoarchaeia archaeon]|jgi:hypothetical protein
MAEIDDRIAALAKMFNNTTDENEKAGIQKQIETLKLLRNKQSQESTEKEKTSKEKYEEESQESTEKEKTSKEKYEEEYYKKKLETESAAQKAQSSSKTLFKQGLSSGWLLLFIVMAVIGFFLVIFSTWLVGLPLIIAAGVIAYNRGNLMIPRLTAILIAMSFKWMPIIPQYDLISVFGVTIGFMAIVLLMPEAKEGNSKSGGVFKAGPALWWGILGVIITVGWSIFIFAGVTSGTTIAAVAAITGAMVAGSIIWKQPISSGWKGILTLACFSPLIFLGVQYLFIAGGTALGGIFDEVQHLLGQGIGSTGTSLDWLLNPTLAVQAQLKPPSTAATTTSGTVSSVKLTVTGDTLPSTGCYDSSPFQIIGRIKNTGTEHISSLDVIMEPDWSGASLTSQCRQINLPTDCSTTITSIPTGVTSTVDCTIESVPSSDIIGATATHTCYVDITATTGYHSTARLPIQFIEYEYGRSKFEQHQLTQRITPSTTGPGPVELSLGGFEQPVLNYVSTGNASPQKLTMITTISNDGTGDVNNYVSAYLYIPNVLLDEGQCSGAGNGWTCISELNCDSLSDEAKTNCLNFLTYKNNGLIAGYTQFDYDYADELLNNDFSICFYNNEINIDNIETSKCVLKVGDVMDGDSTALRKTMLIRGDVLYSYKVTGEASFQVKDCDVS